MKLKHIGSNVLELYLENAIVLFSYDTPVAAFIADRGYIIKTNRHFSKTTSKHINLWLKSKSVLFPGDVKEVTQNEIENILEII